MVGRQNADIADNLHPRNVAMATTFWLSMGYNFGCMIASDALFDSRGGFSGSNYPMKTVDFEVVRDAAMALSLIHISEPTTQTTHRFCADDRRVSLMGRPFHLSKLPIPTLKTAPSHGGIWMPT